MPCSGNASEYCGGPVRLNVYNYTGTGLTTTGTTTGPTTPPPATPPPAAAAPTVVPSVGPWVSLGCYTCVIPPCFELEKILDASVAFAISDGGPRALTYGTTPIGGSTNNSVESCTAACFAAGYPLAGMEYSDECCRLISFSMALTT